MFKGVQEHELELKWHCIVLQLIGKFLYSIAVHVFVLYWVVVVLCFR